MTPIFKYTPKEQIIIRNRYVLKITYMHGDADMYTTETYSFDRQDAEEVVELENVLLMIQIMDHHEPHKHLAERLSERGDVSLVVARLFVDQYMVGDKTMDGQGYATIDSYELTMYDETGAPFEVEVTFTVQWK